MADNMQRFLVPILTLKDNGGGAVAIAFARALHSTGYEVTVVSSGYHGSSPITRPENAGLRFVLSPAGVGGRSVAMILFFLYAIAYSLVRRPRVVYTHIATSLIPDFSGIKPLMLVQDLEYRFFSGISRWLAKLLFDKSTKHKSLVVSSHWLAKFFRRRKIDTLFSGDVGISKAYFGQSITSVLESRTIDFLLIAKRGHHKRHDETCAVAIALAEQGFTVVLIDQAQAAANPSQVTGPRVLDAVGRVKMRELFQQSKVFIGLSRSEGYGLTPLEALSQGCLVVTTPTPSTSHLSSWALTVINGESNLVATTISTALDVHAAIGSLCPDRVFLYPGPYMEDWCNAAVAAIGKRKMQ